MMPKALKAMAGPHAISGKGARRECRALWGLCHSPRSEPVCCCYQWQGKLSSCAVPILWVLGRGCSPQLGPAFVRMVMLTLDAVGASHVCWSSTLSLWFKAVLTPWLPQSFLLLRKLGPFWLRHLQSIFSCCFSSLLLNPPCQKHSSVPSKLNWPEEVSSKIHLG